jgi:hypothetical protein
MVQSEHVTQSLAGLQVGLKAVCKFRILAHELICIFRSRFGRFSGVTTFHKQPQIMSFSTYVDPLENRSTALEWSYRNKESVPGGFRQCRILVMQLFEGL